MAGGLYVYNKHQWALARLAELEPRYARFVGMEAGQKELAKATEHAQTLLQQYVYPQEKDLSQAGNDAQQRVRDILSAAGLQVGSSQVLPPKVDAGFDRIQLTVRAEGELVGLQGALLASMLEPVYLDSVIRLGSAAEDTVQEDIHYPTDGASGHGPLLSAMFESIGLERLYRVNRPKLGFIDEAEQLFQPMVSVWHVHICGHLFVHRA